MGKNGAWDDHKYIMRVKAKGGNGKTKWRYFYSMPEYKSYLASLQNGGKKPNLAETVDKLKKEVKKDTTKLTKTVSSGKEVVDKHGKKEVGAIGFLIPGYVIADAINFVSNTIGKILDKDKKNTNKVTDSSKSNDEKLKDPDERSDYNKRLEYQKNEPDFMKTVPDIPDDVINTKFEDQGEINEVYDPWDDGSSSENCANCSAAYELRRRGYDVEAKLVEDDYNGRGDRAYDYFEGAEVIAINGDGSTFVHNEEFVKSIWNDTVTDKDCLANREDYDFYVTDQRYTAKTIEKGILDNSPPGSRGFIDVEWKSGGAHSIVYEVDSKGKVTIRDSQTWDEYTLTELAGDTKKVRITRTDNLELKENILDAVNTNTDRERNYYADEGYVRKYKKR